MEYSWSIKFQFHFEMCPGRMCRKCQHIQQHELKMISACNGVLLPVTSTSSIFFLKERQKKWLRILFITRSLRGAEYKLLSSFLIFGAFCIENSQAEILLVHLLLTSDSSNMISLLTKENTKLQRTCVLIDKQQVHLSSDFQILKDTAE